MIPTPDDIWLGSEYTMTEIQDILDEYRRDREAKRKFRNPEDRLRFRRIIRQMEKA